MNAHYRDLLRLRLPLFGSTLALLAAGILLWWSADYAGTGREERDSARRRNNHNEHQRQGLLAGEQELREQIDFYRQLRAAGIIGPENRLAWNESLQALQEDLEPTDFDYTFSAQKPFTNRAGDGVFSSTLHLHLRVRHEEELLRALARLNGESRALVLLRQCKLSRAAPPAAHEEEATTLPEPLDADCEMQWLTWRSGSSKP